MIYGQRAVREIPREFPEIDAWAVPVHKALRLDGTFRASDMKDYLGLGPGQRLILSTAGPDDFQEMLWERGGRIDFAAHGIDYWFPGHFSVYDDDSRFYQFFNARRQHLHARRIGSRFQWFRLGEHVGTDWLDIAPDSGSIVISCQQMFSGRNQALLRREIEAADRYFEPAAAFFLLGAGYGAAISAERRVHELHAKWMVSGLKGYDVGDHERPELDKARLLRENLLEQQRRVSERRGPARSSA